MSKKMTPCEKLGYKVGDKFRASKPGAWFSVGEEVELGRDDGSNYPYFFNERIPGDSDGGWPRHIESVEKVSIAKLKPAKQALADAIHQNGWWVEGGDWHKSGELPPVGEVCEAYIDYPPQWIETEIVAHKDGFAIGWCKSVMKGCHGDKAHEFRPLSTERDKAIDEMVCEFIDHHGDPKGGERYLGIAEKLYDAGYRKEVK